MRAEEVAAAGWTGAAPRAHVALSPPPPPKPQPTCSSRVTVAPMYAVRKVTLLQSVTNAR